MAKSKVTMQDIARELGVSKNAVYLALNGRPGVGVELRQRIADTAARIGYGARAPRHNPCIVLAVPEYLREDAYFYLDIFLAVEAEAQKRGCLTIHAVVPRQDEGALVMPRIPAGTKAAGILAAGVFSEAYVGKLCGLGYPLLSVDIRYPNAPIGCVTASNFSAGVAAARYLIGKGHRKIGFVGPAYTAPSVYERWCGFRKAMEEAALPLREEWSVIQSTEPFQLFDSVEALQPRIGGGMPLPSAWFCAGDRIAVAMMNLMATRGVRVPEDVSILGFDDIPLAQMVLPRLTTMHVQRERMGRLAVEALLRQAEDGSGPLEMSLPCALVERDSVAEIGN